MKLRLLSGLAVLAFAASVQALDTPNCKSDQADPFAPNVRMLEGKYKGQCIDTSAKRAIRFLEDFTGEISVANFRYKGKFYMAHIPADGVRQISYMVVDLNPSRINKLSLITHTQLRFKMHVNSPIRLYQQRGVSQEKVADVYDFIISYNYMAPAGVPYDPIKGFDQGLYAAAMQMYATEDEIASRMKAQRNLYEIRLNFYGNERESILKEAIKLSDELQYSDSYDTWTNNCATRLFEVLDSAIPANKGIKPFKFKKREVKDTSVFPAIVALDERNLLSIDAELKLVNSEFGYPQYPSAKNPFFDKFKGKILPEILKIK